MALVHELAECNPSQGIRNPKRYRHERREVLPFETWAEVEAVADELDPRYAAIPIVAVGTGSDRGDVRAPPRRPRPRPASSMSAVGSPGRLKDGGKTDGSVRQVPLRQRVLEALDAMPARIDTPVLFPAPRGGYIDIESSGTAMDARVRAAGLEHRRIYDCRHTFATWAIESGVQLSYLVARSWARACARSRTPTSVARTDGRAGTDRPRRLRAAAFGH